VQHTKEIEAILDTLVAQLDALRMLVTEEALMASSEERVPDALMKFSTHMNMATTSVTLMNQQFSQLNHPQRGIADV
jgi:hypothetical protein